MMNYYFVLNYAAYSCVFPGVIVVKIKNENICNYLKNAIILNENVNNCILLRKYFGLTCICF